MIKVFVDNNPVFVPKNTSALEACEIIGVSIPRFCYHERLNVAGNCRMCLVEIEKAPKPIASCAFPVSPNMRIYTNTPLVQKARENVLEFLLMNHPLDCPVCDQGGECDLQEQTLVFGSDRSRFFYAKRGVEDKNFGYLIKTIITSCFHFTRCVRFLQDIAGQEEFGTTLRGQDTEIGTYVGKSLSSELSGNIVDLCPVGALTSKPYAFTARPWEIKSSETIDICDSVGSNIKVNVKETDILRVLPVVNESLNEEWISDKTRFSFDGLKTRRIGQPLFQDYVSCPGKSGRFDPIGWRDALSMFEYHLGETYTSNPENILIVCGNNVDLETLQALKFFGQTLGVDVVSENYIESQNDLMISAKSNTTFSDILDSDLCLTVGTNVRFEASLLNVRLRKRSRRGKFVKASIGLNENLTYSNDSIGTSIKTLLAIAEGKHSFCKKLGKADKPFIILGESVKRRLDSTSISALVTRLMKYSNVVDERWVGLNFLPLTANGVGAHLVGINTKSKVDLTKKKFIYCVGLDSYVTLFSKISSTDSFVVAQTAFADSALMRNADLILPSTAFVEKESTFVNLEGRIQKTSAALIGPGLARDDFQIVQALLMLLAGKNRFLPMYSALQLREDSIVNVLTIEQNKESFTKDLLSGPVFFKKLFKTSFKPSLVNFFSSNCLTKNSSAMAKCASDFKHNYINFV
jgi:NADH dehydrogenase (ubiquinone) Fe-S protein 1